MAAYEYLCRDCDHEFTVFLSPSELESKPRIKCPHCESDNIVPKPPTPYAKTDKKS
jgi:putative FmdB family regulatory protein